MVVTLKSCDHNLVCLKPNVSFSSFYFLHNPKSKKCHWLFVKGNRAMLTRRLADENT